MKDQQPEIPPEDDSQGLKITNHPALVLLVDDQPLVAESLRRVLVQEKNIDFHYCQDPVAAMVTAEQINPSVILLDLIMPDIDGLTLLRYLRANPATKNIPVVVLSSKEESVHKAEAFGLGANDYLIKWPDAVELTARIHYHTQWYRNLQERDEAFRALRVSQRKLAETNAHLHLLASQDGLTSIANRRYLDEKRLTEWRRAARDRNWLTLMMIDIDFFKPFNDQYGHQAGDDALKAVARMISDLLKRPGDTIGRYGGEEFEVIMPGTSAEGGKLVAERIREAVENLKILHHESTVGEYLTVSIGLATAVPSPKSDPDSLTALADRALYRAKNEGRNRVIMAPFMEL